MDRLLLGECYRITYLDHFAEPSPTSWTEPEDVEAEDLEISTVGWVVKETVNSVALAQTVGLDPERGKSVGNVWVIVKSTITKTERLSELGK